MNYSPIAPLVRPTVDLRNEYATQPSALEIRMDSKCFQDDGVSRGRSPNL
jgi:hypothetical protein